MSPEDTAQENSEGSAPWHAMDVAAVLAKAGSSEQGLSEAEAARRLESAGPNVIERGRGPGVLRLLWRQVNNPIIYLLLGSGAIAITLGKPLDGAVVLGAVVVNAIVGFIQEYRAGRDIEALSQMVPQNATVLRSANTVSVDSTRVVSGDIVQLTSGDRVPADVRLISARNLAIDEAALTGESVPVQKVTRPASEVAAIGDRHSMAYGGTLVTSGSASGVIVATGGATELGRISHLLQNVTELQTPLTRALASVARTLTVAVLAVSALLLVVSVLRDYAIADAFLVAITLAVATIPEGLPAVITIALSIGVQRMAARNAIVRRLPSVETLGSTTVICSDKTGTLTRNEMTVQALRVPSGAFAISGIGYNANGRLSSDPSSETLQATPPDVRNLLDAAVLCNDAGVSRGATGELKVSGDPTEAALLIAARKVGIDVDALRAANPREDVIPFESEHKYMATLHRRPDGRRLVILKGAPEVVLSRLDDQKVAAAMLGEVERLASRGMRVLALARRETDRPSLETSDVDSRFEWLGMLGMIDPPRPEAIAAVQACHRAGIVVKMITGDHLGTAMNIGGQLGLSAEGKGGVTGADLAHQGADELRKTVISNNVFARVAPEHKLRLVEALQAEGQVVAMTGDGVNDAPALKQSDIGIAMGITGTAASKEAADVVLADDNFASIEAAVEEGRRIFDNLIKSLAFVLPTNLGLGLILIAAVGFFPLVEVSGQWVPLLPMLPVQILWVNLVASVALSLPLAFEALEPDAMQRPPRHPGTPIMGRFVVGRTILVAVFMCAGAVAMFLWEYWRGAPRYGHEIALREAQTMAVTTVVFFQIYYLLDCRRLTAPIFRVGLFSNPTIYVGVGTLLLLQAGFTYLPFMQAVFKTAPLQPGAVGRSALVAAVIIPVIGIEKALRSRGERTGSQPATKQP